MNKKRNGETWRDKGKRNREKRKRLKESYTEGQREIASKRNREKRECETEKLGDRERKNV